MSASAGGGNGVHRRRVVITGLGAVTPLGNDVPTFWERLVAGESGVVSISAFDPERLTSKIAGEVHGFDPSHVLDRKEIRRNDRATQFVLVAAREALDMAALPDRLEGEEAERTGVVIGSGLGGSGTLIEQIAVGVTRGPDRLSPFFIPMSIANMPSGQTAMQYGAQGPNFAPVSACATGGHAIGEANEMIIRGDADMMIAGGTEAVIFETIVGAFAAMRALSTRNDDPEGASRPFDKGRDGFVIAEGSAVLVLEELEHARARGVPILAEILGYGASADAYHITLPSPGGMGAVRASRRALQKADVEPSRIDLVMAHATSTPEGDSTELQGLRTLLGETAHTTSITATKSSIGHTLGAAGAIAAVAAVQSMQTGIIPPTLNLVDPDDDVADLDLTPLEARRRDVHIALINAFGFGGQNASVVLGEAPA
jgi:3-oxoacyl-[acyl-carrier-protein] synthase II